MPPSSNPLEIGGSVVLDAVLSLSNCSTSVLNQDDQDAVVDSVVTLLGLQHGDVKFSLTQATAVPVLRGTANVGTGHQSTLNVDDGYFTLSARVAVTLLSKNFPSYARNTQGLAAFVSGELPRSVTTGAFTKALHTAAASYNATSLTSAVVSAVQVASVVTIFEAQSTPSEETKKLSTGEVAGIAVASIALMAVLFYCHRLFRLKQSRVIALPGEFTEF